MRQRAASAGIGILALCGLFFAASFAQQAPAVRQAVPEPQLFFMLFRSVAPPVLQQDSKMPPQVRAAYMRKYQSSAQLSDEQVRVIMEIAVACVKNVTVIDEKARQIITAAREQAKATGSLRPPPELAELQKQKDAIIEQDVIRLRGAIGEDAYGRLAYALSHQNVNERGEDRASFSAALPPELAIPAPPESRILRPDFKMPRESLYESKLPVKIMITPVGRDGTTEKVQFRVGEEVLLKITLLNTVAEPQVLHVADVVRNYQVDGTLNGQRLPGMFLWASLTLVPSLAHSPTINIPYDVPLVIGTLRVEKTAKMDLVAGKYTFILQRAFALRPTINKEEEALYAEIGHFALKSNTILVSINP
jgi:hypothetical protein